MLIFHTIAPDESVQTLQEALEALVNRASEEELILDGDFRSKPWSLVQLRADEADFEWLIEWAEAIDEEFVRRIVEDNEWQGEDEAESLRFEEDRRGRIDIQGLRFSPREGLGWVLLLFLVEIARRESDFHGELWHLFRLDRRGKDRFPASEQVLFDHGQPTRPLSDMLAGAANRLNLRQIHGRTGRLDLPHFVAVQCGLSHPTISRHLPSWLARSRPAGAIHYLLDEGELQSESFQRLWKGLLEFRQHPATEPALRQELRNSPWVVEDWEENLVACAGKVASPPSTPTTDEAEVEPAFLTPPRLDWPASGPPRFTTHLGDPGVLGLREQEYHLIIGGKRIGRFVRNEDEYIVRLKDLKDPNAPISLPSVPNVHATLAVPGSTEVPNSLLLECWQADEAVTVFSLPSGERLAASDSTPMDPSRSYALLLAPGQTIAPEPQRWEVIGTFGRIYLLPPNWSPELQVFLEGKPIWSPALQSTFAPPAWAEAVTMELARALPEVTLGDEVQMLIRHPNAVTVDFVRGPSGSVGVSRIAPDRTMTEPIRLDTSLVTPCLRLEMALSRKGTRARVRRAVELPVIGGTFLDGATWEALGERVELSVEQARQSAFRIWPPTRWGGQNTVFEEWALMEGDTWIGRPARRRRQVTGLQGFGAPLLLCRGPFNPLGGSIKLAKEVSNHGLCRDAQLIESGKQKLRLELNDEVEPGTLHRICWWDFNGSLHELTPRMQEKDGIAQHDCWLADVPLGTSEPRGLAIAYDGNWLGGWWSVYPRNWPEDLDNPALEPERTAVFLRWWKFPMLASGSMQGIRRFALKHAAVVLPIWLASTSPLPILRWHAADEGWLAVVRRVFDDWKPTREAVQRLLKNAGEDITCVAEQLSRIDPVLMGWVVDCGLKQVRQPVSHAKERRKYLLELQFDLADLDPTAQVTTLDVIREQLLHASRATMQVGDVNFVKELINVGIRRFRRQPLEDIERANLAVAVGAIEPFRRLLALHILKTLAEAQL